METYCKDGGSKNMKCWVCGKSATQTRPIFDGRSWMTPDLTEFRRCYCKDCFNKTISTESKERKEYIKLKKHEMFRKAVKLLEEQNTNMYEFKEAIEVVQDFVEDNVDKFDSSYEVLTAIILVQNRIYSKMQYKVGKYQVDFLLPDLLVVLEIDGERHKHKKDYDTVRDRFIKKELGPYWEIIRIPTEHLDKNAKKIPEAINKVLEYRETNHINWRAL
ncbi:MAG: DUF559 domain-containing protein [Clostridiales bacterium]|nr:DUF559 domain-containing protein [Clostridiales bacterium]